MNILFFLTPKSDVAYIFENETLRQTLEKMEHRKFSCIPLLSLDGKYKGSISEGDLLWGMKTLNIPGLKEAESISIMAIPVITTTTEDAINGLPGHYLQASLGLGATRWQSIYHVLIPACIPRIMTGVILAAGRGFGEAAALLYTTGSGTDLRWNNWNLTSPTCPLNIFRPAETLSLQIWGLQINGQDPNLANLSAAILMILVLLFSIGANALSRHINKKNSGN